MGVTSTEEFLKRKAGGPCPVCGYIHPVTQECSRQAMAARITKLLEANAFIPTIMKANKEATEAAASFQGLLKKADEAHTLLMQILSKHGEVGEKIRNEYMERLNAWAADNELTNQDTSEQPSLFSQEPSTSNETGTKPSIKQPSGLVSEDGSLL